MFTLDDIDHIPTDPFFLDHNGFATYGRFVGDAADNGFVITSPERAFEITQDYDVRRTGNRLTFAHLENRSVFSIRPLKLSDKKLLIDKGESVSSLDELIATANAILDNAG